MYAHSSCCVERGRSALRQAQGRLYALYCQRNNILNKLGLVKGAGKINRKINFGIHLLLAYGCIILAPTMMGTLGGKYEI